jgi:hypothetical protein
LVLALFLGGVGQASASILGVDFDGAPVDTGQFYISFGYSFTVNNPVTVVALGNADVNQDSFGGTGSQQVELWQVLTTDPKSGLPLTGTPLASATVDPSLDPLVGDGGGYWRFAAITPVTLTVGQTYVVAGYGGADYSANTPVIVNPNITFNYDLYDATDNNALTFPTASAGYTNIYPYLAGDFGGNVEFSSPEPATAIIWSLLGTLALGLGRWRKRRAV